MTAVTESTSILTEFAGTTKVFTAKITGEVTTAKTLTIEELYSVDAVICTLAAQATADAKSVCVVSVSSNVITLSLVESDGTPCTQNAVDYYVMVIGTAQGNQ